MENFCFRDMYEKWKIKDTWKYRDEWIEDWKRYPEQGYKNLSVDDKLDFHNGVQNDFIPTVIEYGEAHDYIFFHTDEDHFEMLQELRDHPEQFELKHIPKLLTMIDDECYELSWQKMLAEMIYGVILHYKEEGLSCYLQYLPELSPNSYFHGCNLIITWLLRENTGKKLIFSVFLGYDSERKAQLQELLNHAIDDHATKKMLQEIIN